MHDLGRAVLLALDLVARLDGELLGIVGLSLRVSLLAAFSDYLVGAPLGARLTVSRLPASQAELFLLYAVSSLPCPS